MPISNIVSFNLDDATSAIQQSLDNKMTVDDGHLGLNGPITINHVHLEGNSSGYSIFLDKTIHFNAMLITNTNIVVHKNSDINISSCYFKKCYI